MFPLQYEVCSPVNDSLQVNKDFTLTKRDFRHVLVLCKRFHLSLCYLFLPASTKALCLGLSAAKVQNTLDHVTQHVACFFYEFTFI